MSTSLTCPPWPQGCASACVRRPQQHPRLPARPAVAPQAASTTAHQGGRLGCVPGSAAASFFCQSSGHQPRRPHLRVRLLRQDSQVRAWGCVMPALLALRMVVRGAAQPQHDTHTRTPCPYTPAPSAQAVGHGHRPAEGNAGGPL